MKFVKLILSFFLFISMSSCKGGIKNIEVTPQNSVTLRTVVTKESVNSIITQLAKLDKTLPEDEPVYLILDTPGGSVLDGNTLIEYINGLKREVKTIAIKAASMGFIIQQAAGERLVLASSLLMSHPASTGCSGNVYELATCLAIIKGLAKHLDELSAKRMGMNLEDYVELIEHDKYFIGTEMILLNAADRVITLTCSESLMKSSIIIVTELFFGATVKETFSACPFLQQPLK